MRLLSSLLTIPLLAIASAQQHPLQVYLYPTPANAGPEHAPTLSAAQAKAVLNHHLGENIGDFEEIPDDEGLWGHLLGMWNGESRTGTKSRVVIIEGGVEPQEILPSTLSSSPSFYLVEETSTRALLAPYLQRASTFLEDLWHSIPNLPNRFKDIFDLAGSRAASALGKELSALIALADSIPFIDRSKHSLPWEAISISGFANVDKADEVYETGRQGLKAGLEAMTTPDSPPLLLIIVPSQHTVGRRAIPEIPNPLSLLAAGNASAQECYESQDTCSNSTTCSGHGSCVLKGKKGDAECWGCKCSNGYAGVGCQKEDYSIPFVILIFSTLLLVATVVGSIGLLYSVGETKLPSTLNLAIGGGAMKRD